MKESFITDFGDFVAVKKVYVKLYNVEPQIPSTMVVREAREEGFDLYMPLFYKGTCIPYRTS
ncbi:MAG: hypothetical protein A7315_08080 [Candidatus Altiarchaeales archaeon WOR_SM1_79]|nr:MAG: hypothetical protein A7315_08080 [Candidatus Altiarchaeales archaeon WOR_SM1_79]